MHCIIRDRNSFLWFATGEGISRFDGYGFTNYRVIDGLPDRDVRAIVEARDGSFLVATGGGAARFDPYRHAGSPLFVPYALNGGYKTQSVRSVVDAQGVVWIGTDAGLFVVHNGATQTFSLTEGAEQPVITSLARDAEGNLWIGSSAALYVLRQRTPVQQVIRGRVSALLAEGNTVLAATDKGLIRIKTDRSIVNLAPAPRARTVLSMLRSRDGTLWLGTSSDAGKLEPGGRTYRWLGEREGLAHAEVRGLAEDANGDLWVGYDGAGAARISAGGFVTYGETDGLPMGQVASLALDRRGRLIAAINSHPGMKAYRFENGRFVKIDLEVPSRVYAVPWFPWHEALLEGHEGNWWSASEHGLLRLAAPDDHEKMRLLSTFTKRDGMPADDVAHVFEDSSGNVWFSTLAYPSQGRASGLGMWDKNGGHVPSIAQMQAKRRSIILLANDFLNINHVHTFDLVGNLYRIANGAFPSNNSDQGSFTATNCQDGDKHNPLNRGRDAWFRLGEGRSGSDWLDSGSSQQLVNESEVQAATSCAASYVELDFLYARDQVPTDGYRQSGPDQRFENGVWSWQSQDYGQHGPAMLVGGRWVSTPTVDNNGPVLHQAACMKVDNTTLLYGQRKSWLLTTYPTSFSNAASQCGRDHPGYTFSAPVNGYENQQVAKLGDNIWLNYQSKNLGDPYASQTSLIFQYPQGATPAPQTFEIVGQPNKTVAISNLLAGLPQFLVNGQSSSTVTLNANGSGTVTVSMLAPASLAPDLYTQFMRMTYADGTGQPSTLGFIAIVQIAPSITLNPPSITNIVEGTAWTPTVTLNMNPAGNTSLLQTPAPGSVNLVEQLFDSQGQPYTKQVLSTSTNLPGIDQPFTLSFSSPLLLSPGSHSIFAQYMPSANDSFHSRVVSNTVVMNVAQEMTFNPAQVSFNLASDTSSAPARVVTVTGAEGT